VTVLAPISPPITTPEYSYFILISNELRPTGNVPARYPSPIHPCKCALTPSNLSTQGIENKPFLWITLNILTRFLGPARCNGLIYITLYRDRLNCGTVWGWTSGLWNNLKGVVWIYISTLYAIYVPIECCNTKAIILVDDWENRSQWRRDIYYYIKFTIDLNALKTTCKT